MSGAAARGWAQCVIGFSVADRKLAPGVSAAAGARRPTDVVVLETVPAVVVVLDAQGRVVELNRAGEELTGYSGEEIRGRKLWETGLVPEEEQSVTREVFARLRAGDFPNRYENHWISKDGRWRLLSWRNSEVLDECGEVSRVIGTAVDVTEERRALEALQESAERFRATLQTLIDPLVLLTAARDADGTVVDFVCAFANDAACAVSGVAREELIGRRLLEFLPESRSSGLFDAFVRVIETGEPFSQDDLVVAVGGVGEQTERHLNIRVTRVGDQVAITWLDATERRSIEAQLRSSEERFRAAAESMLDALFVVSAVRDDHGEIVDFRYEYVNSAHCKLVGFDREQLLGHRIGELFPEYPGSDRFAVYRRVAVTGEPCRTDDVYHEQAWAGTPIATRVVDSIIASVGENLVVSARDVTERRRNEEELRLRVELLDLAHDAVIVRDPAESRVTFWNREAQHIYGYSRAEALDRVTHELLATVFPESRGAVDDALARDGRWVGELRHTRKDGTVIVVSSRQALQRAADGRPTAIIELNSDITERERAERKSERAERKREQVLAELEEAQHIAQLGSWRWDPSTGTRVWSAGMYVVYGRDPAAGPMDTDESFAFVHADDLERVRGAYARMREGGAGFELDYRLVTADGRTRVVHAIARPDPDRTGCYRGTLQDVTERRRNEQELRLRAELLDLAHDAVIVRDPAESRVTFWNREAQHIYGYSPEKALGQVTHELLATVFPESRQAVDDALAREGRWIGELRHTRKDGTVIVVSSRQALQRGADGRPIAIIELDSDITERKRVEEELAHIAGLLERTEEISKTGGWEYDVATGELTWTDEVYRIYGVERTSDRTEVTQAIAAYDPDSAPIIDAAFKRLVADGVPYDLELGLIRADGQRVWVRTIGRPVIDDGRVVRVAGNISDVTERKRIEEALRASDQLFHDGFDHSPTGMALTGLDGSLVEVNAAFARMLGYEDPAQLAGQDFARDTHPDDLAANREGIRVMVEERKPYVAEKRYIRRDGAVVYALYGATLVRDADGRPSMLFTQVQDITERKLAEAALRASEERFRRGFENSPIGMALTGLDGRLVEVNATFARMLGYDDPAELAGQSFANIVHPDELASGRETIKRIIEKGSYHGERRYIRRDGTVVYALYGATLVRDADGRPSVLFGQVQDITERKLAEAEVHRLNAELERRVRQGTAELKAANQELEGFAYSLAHDLRAPIRAINGFGAALSQSHGEELGLQGRETLDRIRRASAKMGELIDAMLLLSELTRRELSLTSVDLSAVAREISDELCALDPARGVEFVIEDGLETVGDQRLVRVLMRNLLENACRFTSPREHARIEVMRAGAGMFAVADDGVGFNMDFAGLLFEPFARLHREDEFPGIGVGLTTVERIVRRHGGAVWGEGRPGEGATFYFKLEPPTQTGS